MKCVLCHGESLELFFSFGQKDYYHCHNCDLRFLNPNLFPVYEIEVARYREHKNDVNDLGYQNFARPLVEAIQERIPPVSEGLDYGCGDGPVVTFLLETLGYRIALYDPVFQPATHVLERQYDFVVLSETAEHFHNPDREFRRLSELIVPQGMLSVMTLFYHSGIDFKTWHYRNDVTHVCFYSRDCLEWISRKYGFHSIEILGDRIAILRK